MDSVCIFCCGGTIDKVYFDAKGGYQVGTPAAAAILHRAKVDALGARSLIKKDSLDMNDADRQLVVDAVADCPARRVLITHGTDTLCDTGRALLAAGVDKTVVLTGAFLPAAFRESDADFNLGFALACARTLGGGVYVAMNGRVIAAAAAEKNVERQRFVAAPRS